MKFKIGQPVWAVDHCPPNKWHAAVILGEYQFRCGCDVCGKITNEPITYAVEALDGSKPQSGKPWASPESRTFPRDPEQFKTAEPTFDWHSIPVPEKEENI